MNADPSVARQLTLHLEELTQLVEECEAAIRAAKEAACDSETLRSSRATQQRTQLLLRHAADSIDAVIRKAKAAKGASLDIRPKHQGDRERLRGLRDLAASVLSEYQGHAKDCRDQLAMVAIMQRVAR
jgi:hypothetical protein